jgi:integrase
MSPPPHLIHSSPLKAAALKRNTRKSYNQHLSLFLSYSNITWSQLEQLSSIRIDRLFSQYLEHLYSIGGSRQYAQFALSGLKFHLPHLKGRLADSALCMKGWKNLVKVKSHPPLTWELVVLFSCSALKSGYYSEAMAMLLAFHCYLRISELISLRYKDVARFNDPRLGSAFREMALRLPRTKTGKNQWVSIENPTVANLFHQYLSLQKFSSKQKVFPFSASRYRCLLYSIKSSFGLSRIPYVPHSFRHGGATSDFAKGMSIEYIMFRGRWKHMESARNYVQQGKALYLKAKIPKKLNNDGQLLAQHLQHIFLAEWKHM